MAEAGQAWQNRRMPLRTLPIVLTLLICVPFLGKAVHIDDVSFLAVADQIREDPLRPHSRVYDSAGNLDYLFGISSAPLVSYYYALIDVVAGRSEVALHIGMMLFYWLLLAGTQRLSARFADGSVWPTLFVAFSPGVIASGNLMMDIPSLGLATMGLALFVEGVDAANRRRVAGGALLVGLAIVTKYTTLMMLPLFLVYLVLNDGRRWLPALGLVFLPMLLWFVQNLVEHGTTHLQFLMSLAPVGSEWTDHVFNGIAVLGALSLAPLVLLALALMEREWKAVGPLVAGVIVTTVLTQLYFGGTSLQFVAWAALGGAAATAGGWVLAGREERWSLAMLDASQKDDLLLCAWVGGVLFFCIFQVYFQAVRHVLPMLVPVTLLVFRAMQRVSFDPILRGSLAGVVLTCQALLAYWVAMADYAYADTYRRTVQQLDAVHAAPGRDVWFAGGWGFKYYAESAGWRQLTPQNNRPIPGDIIIIPDYVQKGPVGRRLAAAQFEEVVVDNTLGIATMNGFRGAGFYAGLDNSLPFLLSPGTPHETFRIYRALPDPEAAVGGDSG